MNELNRNLRNQAICNGLCAEWQELWNEEWSQEKMIDMYFKGIDFALKYHWPSNEYIKKNFKLDWLREKNVFVDDKRSAMNPYKCIVLGDSDVKLRYNSDYIGDIYLRDNSSTIITARGRSFVMVHVFDNATVTAGQFDKATVVIIKHSPKVSVFANDSIKVKEEYDYLK